ncbi:MAG: MBL fold metallo-hydrolase, partial [Chloroflexia bacterium]|nr:MBL fold metallo-hydrolase [Chloroflexia bacterium]
PPGEITTPYICLFVDTGRNRVLVDTGAGPLAPTTGRLPAHFRDAGIDLTTIDTVVLTHGHIDHIGGNTDADGSPAFPGARFVMWRAEWDFWTAEPSPSATPADEHITNLRTWAQRFLPPIQPQVELIDRETEIVPGIAAVAAPGHTPGNMVVAVTSGGELLLNLSDTALDPIHLSHPEWQPAFDQDRTQAAATRRRLFDWAANDRALVLNFHFPFPGLGHVSTARPGWRWEPITPGA